MPYTYISWGNLKTQLSSRLGDSSRVFWIADEIEVILTEALRTFGILSGFWRERGTFNTVSGTAFYDLPTNLGSLLGYSVTDRNIIKSLQYSLLESASSQSSWGGTEMFTYDDIVRAIERRTSQFLQDTGIIVTRSTMNVPPPPIGRVDLSDNIIDVRRLVWIDSYGRYYPLWREDEFAMTAYDVNWSVNPGTPICYSVMAVQPVQIQLGPIPIASATAELLTVNAQATLDPGTTATILTLPDDLTWIIKWGALADLLGIDGAARDMSRAKFCEQRYQQGVQLTRMLGCILQTQINGVSVQPNTVFDLDAADPNWQNKSGTPKDVGIAGWNQICTSPVPNGVYSITIDVIRKTPIPANDNAFVEVGREQLDMILDYAEHLALFKVGGAEFAATGRQAENFLLQSISYNQRLGAAARYVITPKEFSQKEKQSRPRRIEAGGVGAMPNARS